MTPMQSNLTQRVLGQAALCAAGLVFVASTASAQTHPLAQEIVPMSFDSGYAQNDGLEPEVVISFPVFMDQSPWMRLFFEDVVLAGDPAAGTGSILRVTSLLDGGQQRMNADHVAQWQNSTAYLNGDAVLVEVLAYPGTGTNRVWLETIAIGLPDIEESQCGSQDDRLPSSDPRSGRLLPQGCTGWIINDAEGCQLTAGHCGVAGSNVLQFNVPDSNSSGSTNNPPPEDQYSIDSSSIQSNGGQGIGNDYAYFGTFPNSNSGMTAFETQGSAFTIVNPPTFQNGQQIRITGFGVDSGTRNQTQQTHVGPRVSTSLGTEMEYMTDTEGGNSGSPVIFESTGDAVGIHTHGGCGSSTGNHGTGINHTGLQAFLANPKGICNGSTTANFTGTPPTGLAPLSVDFTNTSTGGITSSIWSFGDGGSSSSSDPSYVYNVAGTYSVSLTVTGTTGSDTETKIAYIVVDAPPTGDATCAPYNGTGVNPNVFACTSEPLIGQIWTASIDGAAVGASGLVFVFGYEDAIPGGAPLGVGELLIDPSSAPGFVSFGAIFGGTANIGESVPNDTGLIGYTLNTQAFFNNVGGFGLLTNAIALTFGTF
ncbi:MAG: PKD repeat protein [Planctomycetota bacterium]|jgi:PKD repeat protein